LRTLPLENILSQSGLQGLFVDEYRRVTVMPTPVKMAKTAWRFNRNYPKVRRPRKSLRTLGGRLL